MKKLFKKLYYFNLIELVLAIGIMAIGMVAVLSILPIGLTEDKVSKIHNYSASASDSIYSFISRELSDDWNTTLASLPESKPDSQLSSTDGWNQSTEGNIFFPNSNNSGVYGIQMTSASGDITDAVGEVLIWQTPITNVSIGGVSTDLCTDEAIGINMEISFPIEKPYAQRRKAKYYFEAYSNTSKEKGQVAANVVDDEEQADDSVDEDDDIEDVETIEENPEVPGEIIINKTATLKIKIVDTQFYNGAEPVYVRVCIYEPDSDDSDGEYIKPFETTETTTQQVVTGYTTEWQWVRVGNKWKYREVQVPVYGYQEVTETVENAVQKGDEWSMEVPAGTKYIIEALHYYGGPCTSYWSTNENQVFTLLNGDQPPLFIPGAMGQVSPAECIEEYVNTSTGNIVLNENQVLYLYEIGQTVEFYSNWNGTYRNSGFDRQDVIILAEVTPNE